MNTDFTRENAIENIAILKIPTKSYRKRLERPETYKFVKRFLDIVLASIGMIVLSPIFLIISLSLYTLIEAYIKIKTGIQLPR